MLVAFIFIVWSSAVIGFNLPKNSHRSKFSPTRITVLYSTQPSSASGNEFAIPAKQEPVPATITMDNNDEIVIDMDALAAESEFNAFKPKTDISDMFIKETDRKAPRQAQWFPFLLSPPALDGSFAGDVGFDPLGFSKDKSTLIKMRDAELKHSRLAMLAAVGWPMSELWHKKIAAVIGLDSILASADKAPSVLNGGLANGWIIGTGLVFIVSAGILELGNMEKRKKVGYQPGDLSFDPLSLYALRSKFGLDPILERVTVEEKLKRARLDMDLCEIKHGRLAMLAIAAFAAQEYLSGIPVVQQTPFFFGDPIL